MASSMNTEVQAKQIPIEQLKQYAANIVAELHHTFQLPIDNSIIPSVKFAKYALCIQVYVENHIDILLEQITAFIYNFFDGRTMTLDRCKEYIYTLLAKYFSKETYSIELISNLLRNHRYLIYLTNYINIISTPIGENPNEYIENLKQIDSKTGLPNYFKLDNVMVVYALLYLLYQNDELKMEGFGLEDLPSLQHMEIDYIVNMNIINSQLESIQKFISSTYENIRSTYLISHGVPTENLSVVPPNKILVIITPLNRFGYSPNKEYLLSALSWMLLSDNIYNFIINPTCFIDRLIATEDTSERANLKNADSPNCILNGI